MAVKGGGDDEELISTDGFNCKGWDEIEEDCLR